MLNIGCFIVLMVVGDVSDLIDLVIVCVVEFDYLCVLVIDVELVWCCVVGLIDW